MDRTQATEFIRQLFEGAMPALPDNLVADALNGALIPDNDGTWPGGDGYVETIDEWWAAATLADWQQVRSLVADGGTITKATSEGSTFEVAPIDWAAFADKWRRRSAIGRYAGVAGLGVVEVGGGDPYTPTSMGAASWT